MKTLLLLIGLALLSGCGGGTAGAPSNLPGSGLVPVNKNINFQSFGSWRVTGVERTPWVFDPTEAIYIPRTVSVAFDTLSTLQFGDVVRISFVTSDCTYTYDGFKFNFTSCGGLLAGYVGGQQLTLSEVAVAGSGSTNNGKVNIGTVTASNDLHSGDLKVTAYLGE